MCNEESRTLALNASNPSTGTYQLKSMLTQLTEAKCLCESRKKQRDTFHTASIQQKKKSREARCDRLWRLSRVSAYVLHLHSHTMEKHSIPFRLPCLKVAKKRQRKNRMNSPSSLWQQTPAGALTMATLRPASDTKAFFYHRDVVLYWSPISTTKRPSCPPSRYAQGGISWLTTSGCERFLSNPVW